MAKKNWAAVFSKAGLDEATAAALAEALPTIQAYAKERTARAIGWRDELKAIRGGSEAVAKRKNSLARSASRITSVARTLHDEYERTRRTLSKMPPVIVQSHKQSMDAVMLFAQFLTAMAKSLDSKEKNVYPFKKGETSTLLQKRYLIDEVRSFFESRGLESGHKPSSAFYKVLLAITGQRHLNREALTAVPLSDQETEARHAQDKALANRIRLPSVTRKLQN